MPICIDDIADIVPTEAAARRMELSAIEAHYAGPMAYEVLPLVFAHELSGKELRRRLLAPVFGEAPMELDRLKDIREVTPVTFHHFDGDELKAETVKIYHRPAHPDHAEALKAIEADTAPHELPKLVRQLVFLDLFSTELKDAGKPVGKLTPERIVAMGEDAQRVTLRAIMGTWGIFLPPLFTSEGDAEPKGEEAQAVAGG